MLRIAKLFPAILLFLAVAAPRAHAAKAHFIKGDAAVTDGELGPARVGFHGGLLVSFVEVGLGNNVGIDYVVTADASATYACGNNGRVTASLPVAPLGPGELSCPSGQTLFLTEVSYTNVVLTDTTNGVTVS